MVPKKVNNNNQRLSILPAHLVEIRLYTARELTEIVKKNDPVGWNDEILNKFYHQMLKNADDDLVWAACNLPIIFGENELIIGNKLSLIIFAEKLRAGEIDKIPVVHISQNSCYGPEQLVRIFGNAEKCLRQGISKLRRFCKNTEIRHKRILQGQWCPVCGPMHGELRFKQGKNIIYCTRKTCGFQIQVTKEQLAEFRRGNLKAKEMKNIFCAGM